MPLFHQLAIFDDDAARGGPAQMALDEALLESVTAPVLRIYRWDGPAVSFGYAQSLAEVRRASAELPLVRRWTGGGLVRHGRDWTFALIVPADDAFAALRPGESYRRIHAVMAAVLGTETTLQAETAVEPRVGGACFIQPVRDDVLSLDGQKVCGGAQRRTRRGLLHQGSVQNCQWPADMAGLVGSSFAGRIAVADVGNSVLARAAELAEKKYNSAAWREKNP